MVSTSISRQGQLFDGSSNPEISLYFASYDDIDELCNVINWAYRGKPSLSTPGERYSGWVGEQHLLIGERVTPDELRELIDDDQHSVLLVAKLKTPSGLKIVGCYKINTHMTDAEMSEEEKNDVSVEFGLHAVDPDYQSQSIGTLLYNGGLRIAKEYFNAQRVYTYIISSKRNQIEWCFRKGFVDTGRLMAFPFGEFGNRFQARGDPSELKFSILTKRLQ